MLAPHWNLTSHISFYGEKGFFQTFIAWKPTKILWIKCHPFVLQGQNPVSTHKGDIVIFYGISGCRMENTPRILIINGSKKTHRQAKKTCIKSMKWREAFIEAPRRKDHLQTSTDVEKRNRKEFILAELESALTQYFDNLTTKKLRLFWPHIGNSKCLLWYDVLIFFNGQKGFYRSFIDWKPTKILWIKGQGFILQGQNFSAPKEELVNGNGTSRCVTKDNLRFLIFNGGKRVDPQITYDQRPA